MRFRVGTSGYAYKEWKGSFYPADLSADALLGHYATRLDAVEINHSFYRMPKREVVATWRDQVPAGFRFALKAPRRITHLKLLRDVDDATQYFLTVAGALGERLGAVLFQLPPHFECDRACLEAFARTLPEGLRAAFEFRHPSWAEDAGVLRLLEARNFAFAVNDGEDGDDDDPGTPLLRTADWGYVRLRRTEYAEDALATFAARVRAREFAEAFVFFKHEDDGAIPERAARFAAAANQGELKQAKSARPAVARGRRTA